MHRTGLVTMLVLGAAGVAPEVVAEDYALSNERIPDALIAAFYEESGTTPAAVAAEAMAEVDAARCLEPGELAALRARVLDS